MKKVLITGIKSYVGNALHDWLAKLPDDYEATFADLRDPLWKDRPFAGYDSIVHVAGIAHQQNVAKKRYDKINRALAIDVAEKAKREGIRQFILLSTMAVYGLADAIGQKNEIGRDTEPQPKTAYGISKYAAERGILAMQDRYFTVCVVRPPMIYGENCAGNYRRLRQFTLNFGTAPDCANERSMIYIGNFCECLRLLIDGERQGVYCPQDSAYHNTAETMEWIAADNLRKIRKSPLFAKAIPALSPMLGSLKKAFGNLTYSYSLSVIPPEDYCLWDPRNAVRATEAGWKPADRY